MISVFQFDTDSISDSLYDLSKSYSSVKRCVASSFAVGDSSLSPNCFGESVRRPVPADFTIFQPPQRPVLGGFSLGQRSVRCLLASSFAVGKFSQGSNDLGESSRRPVPVDFAPSETRIVAGSNKPQQILSTPLCKFVRSSHRQWWGRA